MLTDFNDLDLLFEVYLTNFKVKLIKTLMTLRTR